MKQCVVYVLRSLKDGKLYIGHTDSLRMRLIRHHSADVRSTRGQRHLKLVYTESVHTRKKAVLGEKYLKSGPGHRFLESRMTADEYEKEKNRAPMI